TALAQIAWTRPAGGRRRGSGTPNGSPAVAGGGPENMDVQKCWGNMAARSFPGRSAGALGERSRVAHPIFSRVKPSQKPSGLAGKLLIAGGGRLVAALLRLSPMRFRSLFAWCAHRGRSKLPR